MKMKEYKVEVSGVRVWDNGEQQLDPIVMTLDDFYYFLGGLDVSNVDTRHNYIDGESKAFIEAVIGTMVLNGGEVKVECGTNCYQYACDDRALEYWANSVDEIYKNESFEDTFTCKFIDNN